ncbi:hypothetical protein Ocin01_11297 [Orchesella cincta]|uniref:Uncharacterized protein n=1 Tax=Orchesella cincta TaxID=48709 RepID=A0A1D2MRM8_ORCCI|nr:hypothetical protein Ocin01_11297 [Orchesella cincta]
MMKYIAVLLAFVAVAYSQLLYSGLPALGLSGPSYHNAFAVSADTGIRRYGLTSGGIAYAGHGLVF